ncbi:sigma-70 family RNA polymerase sigma factor [Roseinatronobacter alkalisoli]|uniref:Sigma-70 family RNA polymerase sigma factor n=1 Tax=Roseinatronobacter alkalisoli TaxID=3028235 RepID=A0ABT5T7Q7_9RHOB|nr:sigma-70 family RNA polymerase sigma factor [Roseinatronobacter sp. HJB301]MDD7971094.1 sigma-70 family RNA polymerase sigma factor [Roseinatronobacter sp. HJB301]
MPYERPDLPVPNTEEEIVSLIPALRAFARSFYANTNDADDLVQETLTKALGKIHQFKPGTKLKSWLFTIMRNTYCTRFKIATREPPGKLDCVASQVGSPPGQEWSIRKRELCEAIHRLPRAQREVIVLIGVLGMSYKETADVCACEIGTVKSRLNRARLQLLKDLGEKCAGGSTCDVTAPVPAEIPLV